MKKWHVWLGCILSAALFLRIYRIGFNLPYLFSIDESGYLKLILEFFQKMDFDPNRFMHPTLFHYLYSLVYGLFFIVGMLFGRFRHIADFQVFFTVDFPTCVLIGRYISALAGVATIFATYKIGCRLANARAGVFAAAFIAFNYLHAQYSHTVSTWVMSALFLTVAFLAVLEVFRTGRTAAYAAAGALIGLSIGIEYSNVLMAVSLLCAHFLRSAPMEEGIIRRAGDSRFLMSLCAIPAAFLAVSPYCVIRMPDFLQGIYVEFLKFRSGYITFSDPGKSAAAYYMVSLLHNTGTVFLLFAFAGVAYCIARKRREFIVLLSFPVSMICFLLLTRYAHDLYFVAVIPFLAVTAGICLDAVLTRVGAFPERRRMISRGILYAVFALWLVVSGREILKFDVYRSRPDARIRAKEWMDSNIASDTKILTDIVVNSLPLESSFPDPRAVGPGCRYGQGAGGYRGRYYEYRWYMSRKGLDPLEERFRAYTRNIESMRRFHVTEFNYPQNPLMKKAIPEDALKPFQYYADSGIAYVVIDAGYFIKHPADPFYSELRTRARLVKRFEQDNFAFYKYHGVSVPMAVEIYEIVAR